MEAIAVATNHLEAQGVESGESELPSSRHSSETITRIDRVFYEAAVEGKFNRFVDAHNIECLLTPNKNNVLHVHLTSTTTEKARSAPQSFFRKIQGKLHDLLHHKNKTISKHFVEQTLDKCGGLILRPNSKGETPLHLAARYGHSTIAKLLIERAKTLPRDDIESGIAMEKKLMRATTHENADTALHEAVRHKHIELVEILLEMDPELSNIANKANETPLYLAAERQYMQIVLNILEKVESPAYEGPNGRTALHAAVINDDLGMAKDFLKTEHLRAAIKHPDKDSMIPLHYAVEAGSGLMTMFLLEQDENSAYMQDKDGRTALHIAAYHGDLVIMEMIIRYYSDCSELVDNKGCNALHYAANRISSSVVTRIMCNLSLSNLFNEKDTDGNTPLHHLANSRIRSGIRLVFHNRVDKLVVNKKNQTALDVAYATLQDSDRPLRKQGVIRMLEKAGAKRSQRLNVKSYDDTSSELAFTKKAKESHLIVATLIAMITFVVAFTLPGGTFQDGELKGSPILGHKASFKAFIVSDAIALVMSASAALIHLFSPLNKAKWLDHYFSQIAFSFILVAIVTMIVAFATGTYVVMGSSSIGIAVIIVGLWFFIILRQVLRMSFKHNSLLTLVGNLVNAIVFSFLRFTPNHFPLVSFSFFSKNQIRLRKEDSTV